MTKVMVHSAIGENFSFSDAKYKRNHAEEQPSLLNGNEFDESTIIFSDKTDEGSNKSSQSTICESNSNDSMVNNSQVTARNITEIAKGIQGTKLRAFEKQIISKQFQYMSAETTVINTTYNVISSSGVNNVSEAHTDGGNSSPTGMLSDGTDKSRVVVQILTSNAKSSPKLQTVVENKSLHAENQNNHSFRDDVFKILSKSQSTKLKFGNNSKEDAAISPNDSFPAERQNSCRFQDDTLKASNKSRSKFKVKKSMREDENISDYLDGSNSLEAISTPIEGSTQVERKRRKRSLKSYFLFDKGPTIGDLEHVTTYLQTATPNALRIVHYVLYDKYGLCSSEEQISQTRKNILRFCGYPFAEDSREFHKRANCLQKIPFPILREVHEAIFGKTSVNARMPMVKQLMQVFLKPKRYNKIVNILKQEMKLMSEEEYNGLKTKAIEGPLLAVSVQRLNGDDVEGIKNDLKTKKEIKEPKKQRSKNVIQKEEADCSFSTYSLPAYILKGPGKKLKNFPSTVRNVKKASEKDVSLLHYILYGRIEKESVAVCRRNILEFSGFLQCQTKFIDERQATLIGLDKTDLLELCKILCINAAKTLPRFRRVQKIMEYLQAPFHPVLSKVHKQRKKVLSHFSPKTKSSISKPSQKSLPVSFSEEEKMADEGGCMLRDFRKICSNIECSAPSDLTELNDLLYIKPCDTTEIHEKILNFTRFGFPSSSIHYHYRKTLLFYMGPCIIRKIANLLDIENCEKISSPEDLSSSILKFLMEKKSRESCFARSFAPESSYSRSFLPVSSLAKSSVPESPRTLNSESTIPKRSSVPESPRSLNSESTISKRLSVPAFSLGKSSVEQTASPKSSLFKLLSAASCKKSFSEKTGSKINFTSQIVQQQTKKSILCHKKSVFIHRLNSSAAADICKSRNATLVHSNTVKKAVMLPVKPSPADAVPVKPSPDDAVPLKDFIHHPTDEELKRFINDIIKDNLWEITLGDLVQKVYDFYPKFNLTYRESFIKTEARQILSDLRSNAFNVVKQMQLSQLSM